MREYLNYKYQKVYSEQSRIPDIKFLLEKFHNKKDLTKENLILEAFPSPFFNSKMTVEKAIRMMNYYGLIEKINKKYQLTNFGFLAKDVIKNKTEIEFLEILNYSSYINNLTYHLIIDLLFNISERELSGSSNFFSKMSNEEQYQYIQDKIEEAINKQLHKRYVRYFTHFIRKMDIIDKFGFMPKIRENVWKGIFLISFSDVLKEYNQTKEEIILSETVVKEIRAPLFLSKDHFYTMLSREMLHPFFRVNRARGKEYYIQVEKLVTPLTIIEEGL